MTLRAIGPLNGLLPEPTGILVGFLRDPSKMPFNRYVQMIPAPEISFMYARMDPDDPVRLKTIDEFAWAYDDYRPTGKGFSVRVEWIASHVERWDFPYTLGEATIRTWKKAGVNPRQVFDRVRSNHAALHRAQRCVTALTGATWSTNGDNLNDLLGTSGAGFDLSSGEELDGGGSANANFQIIKRAFLKVKRRIHLSTNGALTGEELVCVMPPVVAEAMATSGEMVNFLKQSQYAKDLTNPNMQNWGLPESYGGFKLVVEDTPRCFVNQKADGTVADVTVSSDKDYILNEDTCYFLSRPGGLDGEYGNKNFSTIQCYHFGGEARVEAFTEPKHELVEGHVVMEDKVLVPALISGFELTDVLTV
jgi:hypothetical protein